jgi:hypothetical protein
MLNDWRNSVERALQRGDWKTALRRLRQCNRTEQQGLEYFKLLCCANLQASRWIEVSTISASASQRYPGEPIFWECWAWSEYLQGETGTAVRVLEFASSRFRNRENLIYMLACVYASAHRVPEAERCLKKAKQLSPDPRLFALKASRQKELSIFWTSDQLAFAS